LRQTTGAGTFKTFGQKTLRRNFACLPPAMLPRTNFPPSPVRVAAAASLFEPRLRRNLDKTLLLAVGLLLSIGLLAIHAAVWNKDGGTRILLRQGMYYGVGLALMALVASRDYRNFGRWAGLLYFANLALLIFVLVAGAEARGAARWIRLPIPGMDFKLQPSEFAKIAIILTLSWYVARLGPRIREPLVLGKTLLMSASRCSSS
jgi:cell division protein FtsW (lipid II flippase)